MDGKTLEGLMRLNQLRLTEEEAQQFLAGYGFRLEMEKAMDALDTTNVKPMVHVVDLVNVLRQDVAEKDFSRESLQEGAPEHTSGYWQVPRLLD